MPVALRFDPRPVKPGQRQRRLGEIDRLVGLGADFTQAHPGGGRADHHESPTGGSPGGGFGGRGGGFMARIGSSFRMTWLTTRRA